MKIKISILVLSLLLLMSSGCTVVGVGAVSAIGGTYYISGEIKESYPVSIYDLYKVSLHVLKEEKIKLVSVENTRKDADILAELSDKRSIKIHIYYNKEGYATIGIRIGAIGNEKRSRELLKTIEKYL